MWNFLGLIPVALAAALLIWVFVVGAGLTPPKVKLRLTPSFLMMRGPYAFTRNPMYLAEVGLWLGWTLFFGSVGVFASGSEPHSWPPMDADERRFPIRARTLDA